MADRKNGYYWVLFKEEKQHIILEWYDGSWLQGLSELNEHQLSQIKEVIEQSIKEPVEPIKPIKDDVLVLEKDYLVNGYFLKASDKNTYLLVINDIKLFQKVIVCCWKLDENLIDEGIDLSNLKNGQKVSFDKTSHIKLLELELYQKYFLPYFIGASQLSHEQDLEDFTFLLKNAYALALEVSGLKTY